MAAVASEGYSTSGLAEKYRTKGFRFGSNLCLRSKRRCEKLCVFMQTAYAWAFGLVRFQKIRYTTVSSYPLSLQDPLHEIRYRGVPRFRLGL